MGKKDKKKGKGAEKTAAKTDKKLSQKMKKELAVKGEVNIMTKLQVFNFLQKLQTKCSIHHCKTNSYLDQ